MEKENQKNEKSNIINKEEELHLANVEESITYRRKVTIINSIVIVALIILFVCVYSGVELFLDKAFGVAMEEIIKNEIEDYFSEYKSSIVSYLENGDSDEIRKSFFKMIREEKDFKPKIDNKYYDFLGFMIKTLVFVAIIFVLFIGGFYVRNNPDTNLFSKSIRTKEAEIAGIEENIRISKVEAKERVKKRIEKEKYKRREKKYKTRIREEKHKLQLQLLRKKNDIPEPEDQNKEQKAEGER